MADQVKEKNPDRVAKKKFLYGGDYKRKAQAAREQIKTCYLCGGALGEGGEPTQVDHLYPAMGYRSPLLPVHKKCNIMKGNKPFTP